MNRALSSLLVAATLLGSATARADAGIAQTLFDDAKRLMKERKFDDACPKLQKSFDMDPAGGTLLHLAACWEQAGKLASAWMRYNDALSMARRDGRKDRESVAKAKIAELGPQLAHLTIVVPEGSRAAGLVVTRGSEAVPAEVWGTATPVDVGVYAIHATAPGREAFDTEVRVAKDGDSMTVEIPPLAAAAVKTATPEPTSLAPAPVVAATDGPAPSSGTKTLGLALLIGGGAVALGGGAFGLVAISMKGEADDHCRLGPSHDRCDQSGIDASDRSRLYGNMSTVMVGAGLVAAGAGLYFTLKAASGGHATRLYPVVAPGVAGIGATARF
jgi:hypothetical protein